MTATPPDKADNTQGAGSDLNEWGIPDWRDPSSYGITMDWSDNRWRWEFFRRRPDLREFFDRNSAGSLQIKRRMAVLGGLPAPPEIDEPGFTIVLLDQVSQRFGYRHLPNPRISNQPEEAIIPINRHAVKGDGLVRIPARLSLNDVLRTANIRLTEEQKDAVIWNQDKQLLVVEPLEVGIAFSLERPIVSQAQAATAWLNHIFTEEGKPKRRVRSRSKWLEYLRIWDARESGASWQIIADAILPMSKDDAGEDAAARPQKARDQWNAADALRFNF